MNKTEVLALLKKNQDPRGIKNWNERCKKETGLKSFGIGLTKLRKYAKEIGRDSELAAQLWKSDHYEARVISLLIDDPKQLTREQAEEQVEHLEAGYLAHVFSSCDATLAKAPFVVDLACDWVKSKDPMRKRCGYGLLYEVSKSKKKDAPDDAFFVKQIERIDRTYKKEKGQVLLSMGQAIMGIGIRNKKLNRAALKVAKKFSPIDFDPDGRCDPFDVVKHLTGDYVKKKLGI